MDIKQYVTFIEEAEKLKSVVRTAWTSSGRRESTAEHSWRLALFAGVLLDKNTEIDLAKLLLMCLIHDIGEIYEGDISAALRPDKEDKYQIEYEAAKEVFSLLPEEQADRMMKIWLEYNENMTPEAKLVKALDKAETIIQHNQGENPLDFDYKFNLEYGKEYFEQGELLKTLRTLIDEKTKEKIAEGNKGVI
ncbi:MAG: HD domain-containing protein [Mobilitalea sp.]